VLVSPIAEGDKVEYTMKIEIIFVFPPFNVKRETIYIQYFRCPYHVGLKCTPYLEFSVPDLQYLTFWYGSGSRLQIRTSD
jgi:hypothetical protein